MDPPPVRIPSVRTTQDSESKSRGSPLRTKITTPTPTTEPPV